MRTAAQVGAMGKQLEVGSRQRGASLGTVAMLAAIAAALLFVLGNAWFSTGAGTDYPEPAPLWSE